MRYTNLEWDVSRRGEHHERLAQGGGEGGLGSGRVSLEYCLYAALRLTAHSVSYQSYDSITT